MGVFRQEYWSGYPFPAAGALPNPGIEPSLLHSGWTLYHLSHQESPFWAELRGQCILTTAVSPLPREHGATRAKGLGPLNHCVEDRMLNTMLDDYISNKFSCV